MAERAAEVLTEVIEWDAHRLPGGADAAGDKIDEVHRFGLVLGA